MNLARHAGMLSWAMAARMLPMVYGFIFLVIVYPAMPASELGRYQLIFQTYTFIALLNKNFVLYPMLKYASEADGFYRYAGVGLVLSVLFNLIAAGITVLMAGVAAGWLRLERSDLLMIPLLLGAFLLRDFGYFVQQTKFRTACIFWIESIFYIGSSAGLIYFVLNAESINAVDALNVNIIAATGSSVLALILGIGGWKLFTAIRLMALQELVQYGWKTLPIGFANAMMTSVDYWILGIFYNPAVVGVYTGARKVYQMLWAVTQTAGMLAIPATSKYSTEGKSEELKALFEKAVTYVFISMILVAFVLFLLAEPIFNWLGTEYINSAPLLKIMLIGAPFDGIFTLIGGLIYGVGAALSVSVVSIAGLVLLIILLIPGVYLFANTGAAIAMTLAITFSGVLMFSRGSRLFGSGIRSSIQRLNRTLASIIGHNK